MTKYLDEKGLEHVFKKVVDIADTAKKDVFQTIGKANGIASLDDNGFVPLEQLGNVPAASVPNKSITREKIADWAVGRDQIEDNSITNGKIVDRSVSTYKIELEGVRLENLHPEVFNKIKDEYLPLDGSATIEGNVTANGFKVVDQTRIGLLCSDGTVSTPITQSEINNICN